MRHLMVCRTRGQCFSGSRRRIKRTGLRRIIYKIAARYNLTDDECPGGMKPRPRPQVLEKISGKWGIFFLS